MFKNIIQQIIYLFGKDALKEKLGDYIYCEECSFTAPCDEFPFNEWDEDKERFCPNCVTMHELVNASEVRLCNECGEEPVAPGWADCLSCFAREEERWAAEMDKNDFEPAIRRFDDGDEVHFRDEEGNIVGEGRWVSTNDKMTSYIPSDQAAINFFDLPEHLTVIGLRFHRIHGGPMPRTRDEEPYYKDTTIVGKMTQRFFPQGPFRSSFI